ncbi:Spy/CpxP family protein refolding chaperone [Variovorax sp. KK3]|uniref:Spy/CpxP family protein refolding chaperone n=1 Tax=Variovorax sp. KK3 TaxID=1855728 RepID=UPI00097BF411|nr:Spy/CpxP family protein refolding chaperone [Variovorax sp. KK3]
MIPSRHKIRMAGLIASAAFACAAFAQAPQPSSAAPVAQPQTATQAAPKQKGQRMDHAQRMERMQAHRAQRLADLKQKLRLESSQEGAWNNFATAQQRPARPAGQARAEREDFAKLSTPQRLERMQARHAERTARFTQLMDSTRNLYATLTPEQQKTFDAETLRFGPRGHGPHHPHGKGETTKS